jgi:PAS domain S-box-containing protein
LISRQKFLQALPAIERYAATVLAVVCTLAIRLVFDPVLGNRAPYVFFFLTIVVVTRLWGRGPGLLATLLGGVAAWYFILEPRFSFAIASPIDAFNLASFFAVGAGISFLGGPSDRPSASEPPGAKTIKVRVLRQTAVLAGAAVVLTGMVLLLLHDFKRAREAEGWVAHTYRVMNSAESVLSLMKDAESGERGYLLTGEPSGLGPYDAAIAGLPRGLKELKDLTADNPHQQAHCVEINRLTADGLAVFKRAIDLRKAGDLDAAIGVVRSGRAEQSMDALRSILNDVMSEENRLLAERTAEAERQASRGHWVLGLGSTALILLLVFASVLIERETVRREELTLALLRHANLLEQAHDSLLTWRLGGSIGYWSRGAEILFGYTREEAVGRSPHDLLQTHHPLGIAHIDAQLEQEGQWKGELTAIAKDGRKLIVESQWTLAVDSQGNKTVLEANRDITERKRAEAENLLLATAIEQAAETVVVTDRDANIQYVNPAFTRTTGYTREEALGRNPRILKSGQHDARFYQELWNTLTTGKLWHGEFTNQRKDGTHYMEEATIAPVRDSSGGITNYIAIKFDITERKQKENALRESESMLQLFVRHAPAAIAMLDREMRYLVVSKRWNADYRLGDRDLRGLSHYEVFPEISEGWKAVHRRCLAGAVETCKEDALPRSDGSIDWLSWEVRPWRRIDDSIGGIIIFSELITERKQAEMALEDSELRYRQLFERSESALALHEMITDAQGNPIDYQFVDVNPAFERTTGLKRAQILGRSALQVLPDLEEYWIKLYGRVAATSEPAVFESYTRSLGRHYAGSAYSPRPNQFAVSFMDITERKKAEEKVRLLNIELEDRVRQRTAELESANRELEAFAHSVSHDLRAPLRGIDGWSLALLEDCGEQLGAQGHKYLDRVRSEAQRMGKLIDDLLHLSRVSRGELIPRPVDLTALAETIAARLQETHPGRAIEFIIAPHLKGTGDPRLLEIALTNLLGNAVKFSGLASMPRVEFGRTAIDGAPAFFVRDNGVGFDMAYAGMLFGPFQRLHKTSEFPGTGIGLATVQRVIHRHGGRIWADAHVGSGATFYFTLGPEKS